MDHSLPTEDIPGILKTVCLFLESINFNETTKALEAEIVAHKLNIAPSTPKFLILTPSSIPTSCNKYTTDLNYCPVNVYPKCYRVQSAENVNKSQDIDVCYAEEVHPHYKDFFESASSKKICKKSFDEFQNDCNKLMCVTFRLLESVKIQVDERDSLVDTRYNSLQKMTTNLCTRVKTAENAEEIVQEVETNNSVVSASDSHELSELYHRHFDEFEILKKFSDEENPFTPNTQREEENEIIDEEMSNYGSELECCCGMDKKQEDGPEVSYTEYAVAYGAAPIEDYFPLDFQKVKYHLLKGTDLTKELLLQALRWRITQTDDKIRNREMELYIKNNLFGLKDTKAQCKYHAPILKRCLEREPETDGQFNDVQSNAARILNCFASLKVGRDYLCKDDEFLRETLLPIVINQKYKTLLVKDMMVAAVQKMSLRKRSRQLMIEGGLIEYLVTFLTSNYDSLNDYCLDYSVALLMNLCLQREAKRIFKRISDGLLDLLIALLYSTRECCIPYVNGTLFAILRDKTINAEAKNKSLGTAILEQAKLTKSEEMKKQLEFIYRMHMKDDFDICPCRSNTEPENELDLLEPELDIGDGVRGRYYGESLLQFYRLETIQNNEMDKHSLKCFCKPVSLSRNVKPYNVTQQGIIPTRKKNSIKPSYEVYLDPVEEDSHRMNIEQKDSEFRREEFDNMIPTRLESETGSSKQRRVSFKRDCVTHEAIIFNEDISSLQIDKLGTITCEQRIHEQQRQPEIQDKEVEQTGTEEKEMEQLEIQEIEVEQIETQEDKVQQTETQDEIVQTDEEQLETNEKQLPLETIEEEQQTNDQQTNDQQSVTEEIKEGEQKQDHFETIEIIQEPRDSTFPSSVQYKAEIDKGVNYISAERQIEEAPVKKNFLEKPIEKPVIEEPYRKLELKKNVKKPKKKPGQKYPAYTRKPARDLRKPEIKNWNSPEWKPKPKMAEYKHPKSNLTEFRHTTSKFEEKEQLPTREKSDMRMPVSYFGCYKGYSDIGRLYLSGTSPCTCTSTAVCPKHTTRNKYSCSCYDKIKCYVDQLDNECKRIDNDRTCHKVRCHMMDLIPSDVDSSIDDCSSQTAGFDYRNCNQCLPPDNMEMTIPYYNCEVLCGNSKFPQSNACHYYNAVFQSRPKLGRTPPD